MSAILLLRNGTTLALGSGPRGSQVREGVRVEGDGHQEVGWKEGRGDQEIESEHFPDQPQTGGVSGGGGDIGRDHRHGFDNSLELATAEDGWESDCGWVVG
ncbi:8-hydroxygeraniol dehydrogenase [Phtheirospermum japonicum]|uniref:8-hydroxygeraniol dehydrogenase n=1 Tax=Phtheirospermum japonicum TaxID=374723 RepID=A0A830BND0_9LAMI|nr:8-hydroxygeraniol dehydrogenase [Phtheirospermum japonicum]